MSGARRTANLPLHPGENLSRAALLESSEAMRLQPHPRHNSTCYGRQERHPQEASGHCSIGVIQSTRSGLHARSTIEPWARYEPTHPNNECTLLLLVIFPTSSRFLAVSGSIMTVPSTWTYRIRKLPAAKRVFSLASACLNNADAADSA